MITKIAAIYTEYAKTLQDIPLEDLRNIYGYNSYNDKGLRREDSSSDEEYEDYLDNLVYNYNRLKSGGSWFYGPYVGPHRRRKGENWISDMAQPHSASDMISLLENGHIGKDQQVHY